MPVGQGTQARRQHAGLGERALRRLDGVDALPGPQRQQPDAVLQRLLHRRAPGTPASRSTAWATSSAARGGPTRSSDPNIGRIARRVLQRQAAYALPAPGTARQRQEGQPARARAPGSSTSRSTRTSSPATASGCSSRPCSTTPSTIPSSSPGYGSGFVELDRFLIDGDREQRHDRRAWARARSTTWKASRRGGSSA